ncbi:hypothetical protein ADK67_14865 [Saccharothrix sp. NRRL B-16348]|uniref:hypothetical protein n=1 Tax=Saccharothrix sp. NRRL B-16348 TaxID=1415542 RepID=UPI0006ADD5E5|nr:hypothetical protein [Saccharothrix sp. NRRL B-16348]KOX27093.1 hypothetical protein ADK67_14865 [Saccharothrix sp. NRRL B-16348]
MTEFVLVEYGDLEGGGFVPHVADGSPAPPAAFASAAAKLVGGNVPQPPEPVDDGRHHPMWSLRQVDVEGVPHWCFAVQGRGGAFGQAGMCQFLFAGADFPPDRLWSGASQLVRPDGRLAHPDVGEPTDTWRRPVSDDAVAAGLRGLFAGETRIVLTGSALGVAATIGALLAVLPSAVVARHVWSTYLVRRPVQDPRPIVTGRWPEVLPGGNAGLRSWLDRASDRAGSPVGHPQADAVVDWLAELAGLGLALPPDYAAQPDLEALSALIAARQLDFDRRDVPGLLDAGDDRLTFGRGRELLAEWAAASPREAITRLVRGLPEAHEQVVFDSVLDLHRLAEPGANPTLFPPAASVVPGWDVKLAGLLRARLDRHELVVEFVRDYVIAPGRPLHDRFHAHESWLDLLGVPPSDPASGIYGVPTGRIVAEIRDTKTLGADSRAFLAAATDPITEVRRVLDGLAGVPPKVAAEFVGLGADEREVTDLLEYALDLGYAKGGATWAEKWLIDVHGLVEAKRRPAVLAAGLAHFTRLARELPVPLLVLALRTEADNLDPAAAGRRKVYMEAAARLESGAKKVRTVGRSAPAQPAPPSQPAPEPARSTPTPQPAPRTPTPSTPQTSPPRTEPADHSPPWGSHPSPVVGKRRRLPDLSAHWPLIRWLLLGVLVLAMFVAIFLLTRHMLER